MRSLLSPAYMIQERPSCFRLFRHMIPCALVFAFANAGTSKPARMAMMAMTTSSSIKVKPGQELNPGDWLNRFRVFMVNVCLCSVLRQQGQKVTRENEKCI